MPTLRARQFSKYHGAGNDFLLFEDLEQTFPTEKVSFLCDRKRGIGADGLILVRPSQRADFQMVYFNQDGSEAALCGNGLRCFAHFLSDQGMARSPLRVEIGGRILTVMGKPPTISIYLPVPKVLEWGIITSNRQQFLVDPGVPHLVLFIEEPVDIVLEGRVLRNHPLFGQKGVNVNFVRVLEKDHLAIGTYERGVEDETLACGTGAVSAAFVAHALGYTGKRVKVTPKSGEEMEVVLGKEVELTGPSTKVFEGAVFI